MLTISTILTIFRIILTPIIAFKIYEGQWIPALILFILAAISDVLDGFLARALKQETILGAFLDPLADKILVLSTLIIMALNLNNIPKWFLFLLLSKELILIFGAMFFYFKNQHFKIEPTILGKTLTFLEVLLILSLLLFKINNDFLYILLFIISALAIITLIQYIFLTIKQYCHL